MKKKGYTLIELLAVIVILAVIALIATPTILRVVDNAKRGANKSSAYGIIEASRLYYTESLVKENNSEFDGKTNLIDKISLNIRPKKGYVYITNSGLIKMAAVYGNVCYFKDFNNSEVKESNDITNCGDNSSIIKSLFVDAKWGEGLLITAITNTDYNIINYDFKIKKDGNIIDSYSSVSDKYLFSFERLSNNEVYQIEVEVTDDKGKTEKSNMEYKLTYEPITTRYLIMEVYDHLDGNAAVINELEFKDVSGNTLSYTTGDVYDSTTNGLPQYWNSTKYWYKEKLYDGKYSYTSNSDGNQTSTIIISDSKALSGSWTRVLIDFGSEVEIKTVNLWTGGVEKRQPKNIKFYRYSLDIDSNFKSTYIESRNESLSLILDKTYTEAYITPTKDTSYFVYPKDTEVPVIKDIKVSNIVEKLQVQADVVDPYYSSGIKSFKFALVKDNGNLAYDDIPFKEVKSSNIEYDLSILDEGNYYIYVEVIDNALNKSSYKVDAYRLTKSDVNTRYLVMDVYDHFSSNATVITELEFYDNNGIKLTYNLPKVYESATKGLPQYWNNTKYWYKDKLYDGNITYTSNTSGGQSSTIIISDSKALSGMWARVLIDFSTIKNIKDLKIWLGGPEGRTPKEVHFYISEDTDEVIIYDKNIKNRDNTSLIEVSNILLSNNITKVTEFEKNNLTIYKFEKLS